MIPADVCRREALRRPMEIGFWLGSGSFRDLVFPMVTFL
jgi:hypothetical protein